MSCNTHGEHEHKHGTDCGHQAVEHEGHIDFVHDGHLHHVHDDHVDEHSLAGNGDCTPEHKCDDHEAAHKHGPSCGHDSVPHGDHTDYIVNQHLHHPCSTHCDDHGKVATK